MKLLFIILLFIFLSIIFEFLRVFVLFYTGHKAGLKSIPYQQSPQNPNYSIFIAGDSLGVGTGSKNPKETIAGYLGQDHPNAKIVNISENGMRGEALLKKLKNTPVEKYDMTIIFTGGGDILFLTNPDKMAVTLRKIAIEAKKRSSKVILISAGNVGLAKIMPWFLKDLYTRQSWEVRKRFKKVVEESGIIYIDLFTSKEKDPFQDDSKYYGPDGLHLSGWGYKTWYEKLKAGSK